MNKKTIEQAAKETVQEHYGCNKGYPCSERDYCMFCNGENLAFDCVSDCDADAFGAGFMAGAHWRINSVWHSPDEHPEINVFLLAEDERKGHYSIYKLKEQDWNNMVNDFNVIRWAYISDLIPNKPSGIH